MVDKIKRRVHTSGKKWHTYFKEILWAYRFTRRGPTGEIPFSMSYGIDPISPMEINIPTLRVAKTDIITNDQRLLDHNVFLNEWRDNALLRLEACARCITQHYNKRLKPREFHPGDYVLPKSGKLGIHNSEEVAWRCICNWNDQRRTEKHS